MNIPEDELMPCPFCGGRASYERMGTTRQSCIISCDSCGLQLETGEVFSCGERWNRRHPEGARTCESGHILVPQSIEVCEMATDRRQATSQTLDRAIHIYGPDAYDTKIAAIQCCHAYGLDPYYRYAIWPKLDPMPTGDAFAGPLEVKSIEEWQRMIKRRSAPRS